MLGAVGASELDDGERKKKLLFRNAPFLQPHLISSFPFPWKLREDIVNYALEWTRLKSQRQESARERDDRKDRRVQSIFKRTFRRPASRGRRRRHHALLLLSAFLSLSLGLRLDGEREGSESPCVVPLVRDFSSEKGKGESFSRSKIKERSILTEGRAARGVIFSLSLCLSRSLHFECLLTAG